MGPVVVGTASHRHLVVANDGVCDLQYKLIAEEFISGPYGDDSSNEEDTLLGMNGILRVSSGWRRGVVVSVVGLINEVNQRWAR